MSTPTSKTGVDREVRKIAKLAEKAGWTVSFTKGHHIKFTSPEGKPIFASGTPGDHRATKNLKSDLRRAGLEI